MSKEVSVIRIGGVEDTEREVSEGAWGGTGGEKKLER